MGYWATATGKEGPKKEFYEDNIVIDRCIFCGQEKEIKTKMTIFFSEHRNKHRAYLQNLLSRKCKTSQSCLIKLSFLIYTCLWAK